MGELRAVPKTRPCECGCGKQVVIPRRFVSGHNGRMPDHIYRNGRSYKEIKCSECGKKFERRIDQINRYGLRNFCSRECVSKHQSRERKGKTIEKARKGTYKNCKRCGKEFYVRRSTLKKGAGKFCSKDCQMKWQRERGIVPKGFISSVNNAGRNNGMYKHGKRIGGHISKKEVRQKVIERDGYWCLLCGKPGPGLHLHRVVYGSHGGKYEVDNCVLLCAIHHDQVHSSKKTWAPRLEQFIKERKKSWNGLELWKNV